MLSPLPRLVLGAALLSAVLAGPALAQEKTLDDHFQTKPGTEVRVGVFGLIGPNCTPAELKIGVPDRPKSGIVTIRQGTLTGTAAAKCPDAKLKGYAAFYKPSPNFTGDDTLSLEVKAPSGQAQLHKVTVTVAP